MCGILCQQKKTGQNYDKNSWYWLTAEFINIMHREYAWNPTREDSKLVCLFPVIQDGDLSLPEGPSVVFHPSAGLNLSVVSLSSLLEPQTPQTRDSCEVGSYSLSLSHDILCFVSADGSRVLVSGEFDGGDVQRDAPEGFWAWAVSVSLASVTGPQHQQRSHGTLDCTHVLF